MLIQARRDHYRYAISCAQAVHVAKCDVQWTLRIPLIQTSLGLFQEIKGHCARANCVYGRESSVEKSTMRAHVEHKVKISEEELHLCRRKEERFIAKQSHSQSLKAQDPSCERMLKAT